MRLVSVVVWLAFGVLAWMVSPCVMAQEEESSAVVESSGLGDPVVENFTINGRFVRVVVSTPTVQRDEDDEPIDVVEVVFEPAEKGGAVPPSTAPYEQLRIDEWHDFTYELREAFHGTMRFEHKNAAGETLGSVGVPIEYRAKTVHAYEETVGVGPVGGLLELIPGFPEPIVLQAEGFWDNFARDVTATYELVLEGPGAADFVVGAASYRADSSLDIHWWGGLVTDGLGEEAAEDATADRTVKIEFRGGVSRIFVMARPGAGSATLIGRPTTSASPLSPIRLELEGGVTRAGGDTPLVLERMRKYDGFWRVWMATSEPLASPWRQDGGSLHVKSLIQDGEDWLEMALPFSACDWVVADPSGTRWTFTGHRRELDVSQPMRLVFEWRDDENEIKGTFEIEVD